ncbi:MAG: hypothetical protein NTZ42_04835 [Candidatus Gribaldobacteria bacterium]|nr:hypothetical protein [Candidatus Gribaldobacteria bacterium]
MLQKYKIILGLLIFVAFLALIFLFRGVISRSEKPLVENDELKLLRQFFPEKSIAPQSDEGHHIIDGKDYYVKSMGDINHDGSIEFVSMEIVQDQGKTYRFYKKTANGYLLLGKDTSLIWHLEDEKNKEMEFIMKDITGDGTDEILIPFLISGSNVVPYHIFMIDSGTQKLKQMFEKSYFSAKPEGEITFDEIYRENNLVIMTWHGTNERGKIY